MSGELLVSGGGSTAVAVDELFAEAARLTTAEAACAHLAGIAAGLLGSIGRAGGGAGRAEHELAIATHQFRQAAELAASLGRNLDEAALRYGSAEHRLGALRGLAAQLGAWAVGASSRFLVWPLLAAAGGAFLGDRLLDALGVSREGAEPLVRQLLVRPGIAETLGSGLDSVDELVAGAVGVPLSVAVAVGGRVEAPDSAAAVLVGASLLGGLGAGLLVERPVGVRRVAPPAAPGTAVPQAAPGAPPPAAVSTAVPPPSGVAGLAARVPTPQAGAPQIRIEQYPAAGGGPTRWLVYVTGTIDPGVTAGRQPFDMTSNVHSVAGRGAALAPEPLPAGAGERAVRAALAEAGVRPGDELIGIGYSGGGAIVADLMADPQLGFTAGANLGGPARIDPAVPLLNIEHRDDLVPGSGGADRPLGPLLVQREVAVPPERPGSILTAHELDAYRRTAELVDASGDPRLAGFSALVTGFTAGRTGEASFWLAEREPVPDPEPVQRGAVSPSKGER
ncbi:hypothetical protein M3147_16980 [Agromyces mediolanus]|uniref:hypothetical protein n=1 Tax=Agromyces mediolanus TaxID=41986 RepID=UPI00203B2A4A|nr:hypothetical protein [Agromyces mediolanus]MCM3658953.1 hypothetical protein [Agromyces mediolanus]